MWFFDSLVRTETEPMHAHSRHPIKVCAKADQRRRSAVARGGALGAVAARPEGLVVPCGSVLRLARGERGGAGARLGRRWLARSAWRRTGGCVGRAQHIMGAGCQGRQAWRAALSRWVARGLAAAADPRPRAETRRCAVRAGRGGAVPRSRFRDRRVGGQSARAGFHRLASVDAGGRTVWRAAISRPARCAARSLRRADAVGSGERAVAHAALECSSSRHARVAGRTVPLAPAPPRPLDAAR